MKYIVKFNCHDWPKRGDTSKREVMVDAVDEAEAMRLAILQAKQTWLGAKLKAFDCVADRIAKFEASQVVSHETLVKRGRGRPRKAA